MVHEVLTWRTKVGVYFPSMLLFAAVAHLQASKTQGYLMLALHMKSTFQPHELQSGCE